MEDDPEERILASARRIVEFHRQVDELVYKHRTNDVCSFEEETKRLREIIPPELNVRFIPLSPPRPPPPRPPTPPRVDLIIRGFRNGAITTVSRVEPSPKYLHKMFEQEVDTKSIESEINRLENQERQAVDELISDPTPEASERVQAIRRKCKDARQECEKRRRIYRELYTIGRGYESD